MRPRSARAASRAELKRKHDACGDTIPDCNGACPDTLTCLPNMDFSAGNCVQLGCCQVEERCFSGDVLFLSSPDIAPAPAISQSGVLLAVALLVAIGGIAGARRQYIAPS